MIEFSLIGLILLFAVIAGVQRWNFVRSRHLLQSGGWSVFHATYGGTTSEWHYEHKDSKYGYLSNWTLGEAYQRQVELDKIRRLDLPEPKEQSNESEDTDA